MLHAFLENLAAWAAAGAIIGCALGLPVVLYALWGRIRGVNK
jgi:hypothetical protein